MHSHKALFLDRDGVINIDKGYTYLIDNFRFIPQIFQVVRKANLENYKVIIVTNQSGIGRGYFSNNDFMILMKWVKGEFFKRHCVINGVYHCPYHPTHGIGNYRRSSNLRKPKPGMFLKAALDFNLDLAKSIAIGNSDSDMEAAHAAGIPTRLHFGVTQSKLGYPIETLDQAIGFIKSS